MMPLMRFQTIKKTSTAHQLSPQLTGIRRKGMTVPCRLMNANLRLIIAYWNIYVKSLYLFEHGNQLSLKENKQYVILSVSEGTLSQNRHKCKDSSSLCSSE